MVLVGTNLVIDGVERAALDFDENIVGSLEVGEWDVDKLEYVWITWSLESDSVHGCGNRRHVVGSREALAQKSWEYNSAGLA